MNNQKTMTPAKPTTPVQINPRVLSLRPTSVDVVVVAVTARGRTWAVVWKG